ncbi:MAG: ComF family protein [Clostridia bacterium]|nr:ComF family protein [Clostridia bacterium]
MRPLQGIFRSLEGEKPVCICCRRRSDRVSAEGDGVCICSVCYNNFMKSRVDDYYDVGGGIRRLFAPFAYDGEIRRIVHELKFRAASAYALPLARLIFDALPPYYDYSFYDFVIPVPLHWERLEERGYNQAELLAAPLARLLGIPMADDVLFRIRKTERQMVLTRARRIENVKGAFWADKSVSGKNILLIDDIYTVGATVGECAAALREKGAADIDAVVLCTNFNKCGTYERPPTIPAIRRQKN